MERILYTNERNQIPKVSIKVQSKREKRKKDDLRGAGEIYEADATPNHGAKNKICVL